jgi:HEPN domain-containing protein/predicted nucleotidyltransferase
VTTTRTAEDQVLEQVTRTIAEELRPRRIVLFGSRARGTAAPDSDYDIMVEMETDLTDSQRVRAVRDLFPRRDWSMDIHVYTPDELRRWKDDVGFIVYDIVREGRVLFCRPDVTDGDFWSVAISPAPRVREVPGDAPESLASWLDRARDDFAAMQAVANVEPPVRGAVCFHAHQCVEKLLKACLIARSIRPPRTHDLGELLDRCIGSGFDLEQLRASCETLNEVWPKSRYPRNGKPSGSDAQAAIAAATAVRDAVLPLLDQPR